MLLLLLAHIKYAVLLYYIVYSSFPDKWSINMQENILNWDLFILNT